MDVGGGGDTLSEFQVFIFSSLISISEIRHNVIFGAASFVCDNNKQAFLFWWKHLGSGSRSYTPRG